MRDRRVRRQRSERQSCQASPFLGWKLGSIRNPFQNSGLRQHLAKLLGCRSHDCDEVGLAKPALDAMALQVTARAAMKHRRMSGGDAGIAEVQAKRQDATPHNDVRIAL